MTDSAKKKISKWFWIIMVTPVVVLALLLGVPTFILCGFTHSIADAFYFLVAPKELLMQPEVAGLYVAEVLGNFVGCNLYRWMTFNFDYK